MKKCLINIILFFLPIIGFSQANLVPNWSFEDTIQCPMSGGEIAFSKFWFTPSSYSSSDYFNSCSTTMNIPNTVFGFQNAKTGNAVGGLIFYGTINPNYREYIEAKLVTPLEKDSKYCVEFYVNLANDSRWAIDKFGMCFTKDTLKQNYPDTISTMPQVFNPLNNIITDTVIWTKISGEYLAKGGEQFITIGNFFIDDSTQTEMVYFSGFNYYAYYFIDDVSVYLCPDTIIPPNYENEIVMVNAFTPNNDGVNDIFNVKGNHIKEINAKIFNRWGQELFEWNVLNGGWDGKYKGKEVSAGTYFYVVTVVYENGKTEERHGVVTLVR